MIRKTSNGRYTLPDDKELTAEKLQEFVWAHDMDAQDRWQKLGDAYKAKAAIFKRQKKAPYKPDNRITANLPKYITDVFEGFFCGVPVRTDADDKKTAEYVEYVEAYNGLDDVNAELSKMASIYGHAYDMYYVDDDGQIGVTCLSPIDAFMIYDESVLERPRYFVRVYRDSDNVLRGSLSDDTYVRYFHLSPDVIWDEERVHGFSGVPATEYVQNADRMGIYEGAMSMIEAHDKAISEKANDVDYFADAYLSVLGAKVKPDDLKTIRDNRIINFAGVGDGKLTVEFLGKPNADDNQEHLIDRLERLIYQTCMVANISDENFGNSSGIALKYKLHAMSSLAKTKERKFSAGFGRRWKLICSNPVSGVPADAWVGLHYTFTTNMPASLLEEAQTAVQLEGIVSKETQLKVLSIVDNIKAEIDAMNKEDEDLAGGYAHDRIAESPERTD